MSMKFIASQLSE